MDLEKENSGLESVSDNEALAKNGTFESGDDILSRIENTGTCETEPLTIDAVQDTELANLMPVMVTKSFDSGSPLVSPGTAIKGKGLRKWRRIRREAPREGNLNVDSNKLLKRGLSNAVVQPGKTTQLLPEMRQMSEGSVSSSNDRPVIGGHVHDRNRTKSSSGKSSTGSVQKVQKGKIMAGASKKLRGQVIIEKHNSYSSMESDSRSPNVVLMRNNSYVSSSGRQNGGVTNYAGENGNQAYRQGSDQFQTSYVSDNGTGIEDVPQREMSTGSSPEVGEENSSRQESSTGQDPLIESIRILQSVQEALEKEVQRFREIGNEDIIATESTPSEWASVDLEVNGESSSGEDGGNHLRHGLESEISSLRENAHLTTIKLKEMKSLLKEKEADISNLEARLDVGAELDSIFRGKIEAEVKYLTISKTFRDIRVASVDKISILEQRIASDNSQIQNNLGYVESIDVKLRRDSERYPEDVCHHETFKLKSNLCKYTLCFLLQLVLLIVVFALGISKLSPHSAEVVPT